MDDITIHFPFAGVDVSEAVGRQPNREAVDKQYARTTARGYNVRSFDTGGRARGGIRPGLEKYVATRPGDVEYVTQHLFKLVTTGVADPGGGTVQPSQSGRLVLLGAVSNGNVYTCPAGGTVWTIATNDTGETPPLNATGIMFSASNNQRQFFADGINKCYYDPVTNTLRTWTPTAGAFPVDASQNTPRLICTWRGRTVQAGLLEDPSVIFMTKVSDPFDFDYSPAVPVPADAAWGGHTGPQGLTGDVITALIPYNDDILIIGMDSSLALFRGDPNAGGQIDAVTTTIGMAWGEAWCMDPNGAVYFFSNRCGVFGFVPGNQPVRISTAIDPLLENINTGEYGVRLIWNDRYQCLHVFVTLLAEPLATRHFTWEQKSNAWWVDTFTNTNHNPLCCCVFDGNLQDDRVALIGSWDGYVRSLSSDATDDDGTDIESEVWLGPFLTEYSDAVLMKEIQGVLGKDSDDVSYAVYTGDTAEECLAVSATPVSTGTFGAGRNYTDAFRRAGYAAYVALSSVGQWAMESVRAQIDTRGAIRRRGK